MATAKLRLTTYRANALVFAIALLGSVFFSSFYPAMRGFAGRQAQHQLCEAAAQGKFDTVKLLLRAGADPNGTDPSCRPMHFAARNGHTAVVRLLLDRGADISSRGAWNQTPLMETVWDGRLETARFLLYRGASLFAGKHADGFGTALWEAATAGRNEMVLLFMRNGGKDCKDAESVLTLAVENNHTEMVKVLLEGGVDPRDVTATPQVYPLTQVAAKRGNKEMLRTLKKFGAK